MRSTSDGSDLQLTGSLIVSGITPPRINHQQGLGHYPADPLGSATMAIVVPFGKVPPETAQDMNWQVTS